MQVIGKLINVDLEKSEITIKLMFISEDFLLNLLDNVNKMIKFNFISAVRYVESVKSSTRRRWFQVISHILKETGISITKPVLSAAHISFKESLFDCNSFEVDGKIIPLVPSINDVPDEKVKEALDTIIDRYSSIGIDFKGIL